ncbi:MAG: DNA/RNA nuclease SfsA [Neomegalonema sp.]|nr:DNA/RNA nuclease SfsA [Neomegalonema sp.]
MQLPSPLVKARLIRRYKRFLADCLLESGETITAHVANPGSMLGLQDEGATVWLHRSDDPKRKLAHSWLLIALEGAHLCGVATGQANRIVEEALRARQIPELAAYGSLRREVKYGENSRIDFLLSEPGLPDAYVEVKSVTLSRQQGLAEFPDAKTARGAKHLAELARMVAQGHRAVMLYLVQRTDCTRFCLAGDIDPAYLEAYESARACGVQAICYACAMTWIGDDRCVVTIDRSLADGTPLAQGPVGRPLIDPAGG